MANGRINFGKQSGGVLGLLFPDGATNTEVTLPESGTLATTASATESAQGLIELATTAETQAGTDDTRAITPLKLKNSVLGLGQTWQDVTASRVAGTTYTNSTGKPIIVIVEHIQDGSTTATLTIDGVSYNTGSAGGYTAPRLGDVLIVPNNSRYKISGTSSLIKWLELR